MKTEQLILAGAVAFAAYLVAQKTGFLTKVSVTSGRMPSGAFDRDTIVSESAREEGYDPDNPGNYVFLADLMAGVEDADWGYTPSRFESTANDSIFNFRYPVR